MVACDGDLAGRHPASRSDTQKVVVQYGDDRDYFWDRVTAPAAIGAAGGNNKVPEECPSIA